MFHFKEIFFFPFLSCVCFQTCRKALIFPGFFVVVVFLLIHFFSIFEHPCRFGVSPLEAEQAAGLDHKTGWLAG